MNNRKPTVTALGMVGIGMLALCCAVAGAKPAKHVKVAKLDAKLVAAGAKVYTAQKCDMCHMIGAKGFAVGPNLTHVGGPAKRTVAWFAQKVINPKASNPASTMPSYKDKVKGKELLALATYMKSLK